MWVILVFTEFPCWCCSEFLSFISLILLFLLLNISKSLAPTLEYLYPVETEPPTDVAPMCGYHTGVRLLQFRPTPDSESG